MLRIKEKQQSFYSILYDKIPEKHLLKLVVKAVDFSFVNTLLAESYCKDNGRPAKEPEMMMKLLFLQYIYNLSDVDVIKVVTYTYDSWGKALTQTGTKASTIGNINPFRYRGYYLDTETNLYYLNSRYYDADVCRFLNADGLLGVNADMSKYNMYAYCSNNPVNMSNPSGMCTFKTNPFTGKVEKVDCGRSTCSMSASYKPATSSSSWGAVESFVTPSNVTSAAGTGTSIANSINKWATGSKGGQAVNAAEKVAALEKIEKFGKVAPKAFGAVSFSLDVGIDMYRNIYDEVPVKKIVIDVAVDGAVSGGSIWAAGAAGA